MKILLSIKPEYVERILDGTKRFEFRRRIHNRADVNAVLIYATMPVGRVVGEFTIERIHSQPPSSLWNRTKSQSGITRKFFREYFEGRKIAHAIEIKSVKKFDEPQPLSNYLQSGVAPQSYAYIPTEAVT